MMSRKRLKAGRLVSNYIEGDNLRAWIKEVMWSIYVNKTLTEWLVQLELREQCKKMVGPCHATRQVSPVHTGKDFSNASSWKVNCSFNLFENKCDWTPPFYFCSLAPQALLLQGLWPFLSCLAPRQVLSHQISIQVASINISTEFIFFNFLWPSLRICWLGDWRPVCPKMDSHIC